MEATIETQVTGQSSQPANNPWEKDWSQASQSDLLAARKLAPDQATQDKLANLEHRAYARETVEANPLMAASLAVAIPAYQAAKAVGLTNSRSSPSLEQATEAYKGVGEGLAKPWEKMWNSVKETVGIEPTKPADGPWNQNYSKNIPQELKQAAPNKFEQVFSKLISAESGGKHTDAKGYLLASGVGAEGITQLMRATAADPGYGVQPVKDRSEKEYKRFGRDYLTAMLKEFDGDYEKALAAYNAGVGNVKTAIAKGGKEWKSHLPKQEETLPYIKKILKGIHG